MKRRSSGVVWETLGCGALTAEVATALAKINGRTVAAQLRYHYDEVRDARRRIAANPERYRSANVALPVTPCEECHKPLPERWWKAKRAVRFCSNACRQRAYRHRKAVMGASRRDRS